MSRLMLFIPLCGVLLLSGCAGTNSDFECDATTSDTCMTMEQANEKAKKVENAGSVKAGATSLPRLADGNFRTLPAVAVSAPATVSMSSAPVTPEQTVTAPRPLFTPATDVKKAVPVSVASRAVPPRPLRLGEQTAALWIAPYIDSQDIYHQPSSVFFVIKPAAWGKPRIN